MRLLRRRAWAESRSGQSVFKELRLPASSRCRRSLRRSPRPGQSPASGTARRDPGRCSESRAQYPSSTSRASGDSVPPTRTCSCGEFHTAGSRCRSQGHLSTVDHESAIVIEYLQRVAAPSSSRTTTSLNRYPPSTFSPTSIRVLASSAKVLAVAGHRARHELHLRIVGETLSHGGRMVVMPQRLQVPTDDRGRVASRSRSSPNRIRSTSATVCAWIAPSLPSLATRSRRR